MMPFHSPRPCSYPGCNELVQSGGRCPRHRVVADQQRGHANERGYGSGWRKRRDAFLQKHPWCLDPFGDHLGEAVRATHVDHKKPRAAGGSDDESNLEPFCAHCHNKKTAMQDGGFGNSKVSRGMGC